MASLDGIPEGNTGTDGKQAQKKGSAGAEEETTTTWIPRELDNSKNVRGRT
jgi:hypothetical protein